jgi:hypothetical protein
MSTDALPLLAHRTEAGEQPCWCSLVPLQVVVHAGTVVDVRVNLQHDSHSTAHQRDGQSCWCVLILCN